MNWLKQCLALLLLATWLPAVNHCHLEAAGILGDHCAETEAPSQADPCDTGCKLVEKSDTKVADRKFHAPIPLFVSVFEFSLKLPDATSNEKIREWPPESLSIPQFVLSTAQPIRAPSFVS